MVEAEETKGEEIERLEDELNNKRYRNGNEICWPTEFTDVVKTRWPNRHNSKYNRVKALLVSRHSDDLGVINEIDQLSEVFSSRRYQVSKFLIPDEMASSGLQIRFLYFTMLAMEIGIHWVIILFGHREYSCAFFSDTETHTA